MAQPEVRVVLTQDNLDRLDSIVVAIRAMNEAQKAIQVACEQATEAMFQLTQAVKEVNDEGVPPVLPEV